MKLTSSGRQSAAQLMTSRFVLAVSVTTAPLASAGAIASNAGLTCRIGVAMTIKAEPSAASAGWRASLSIAPSFRASLLTPYSASWPTISRSGSLDRFKARPIDPPISPSPMMATLGIRRSRQPP